MSLAWKESPATRNNKLVQNNKLACLKVFLWVLPRRRIDSGESHQSHQTSQRPRADGKSVLGRRDRGPTMVTLNYTVARASSKRTSREFRQARVIYASHQIGRGQCTSCACPLATDESVRSIAGGRIGPRRIERWSGSTLPGTVSMPSVIPLQNPRNRNSELTRMKVKSRLPPSSPVNMP